MWPYILIFLSSCFIFFIGELFYKKYKPFSYMIFLIGIIIPSVFAAFRDYGIGTDMTVYGNYYFELAQNVDITTFFTLTDCELGYGILVYIIAYFSNDIHIMYFFIEFIILLLTFLSIFEYTKGKNVTFGMLIFYLVFFSYSLNLMRQCLAISMLLFSFKFVKKQSFLKFIICQFIAILFHKTAILAIVIYPIYQIVRKDGRKQPRFIRKIFHFIKKYKWTFIFLGFSLCLMIVFNAREIITFIRFTFNDFHYQYDNLISNEESSSFFRFSIYFVLLFFATYLLLPKKNQYFHLYFIMMMLNLILYQLKSISPEAYRVSLYFTAFTILALVKIVSISKNSLNKYFFIFLSILLMSIYAYDYYVIQEYNQTYPYTSEVLGIN